MTTRHPYPLIILLSAILLLLPIGAGAQPTDPILNSDPLDRTAYYLAEHGDFDISFTDGQLGLHIHLHAGAIVDGNALAEDTGFVPDEVSIVATNEARISRPDGPLWDATGVDANEPLWVLPQHERENVPAFGLATEEIDVGVFLDDAVTLSLRYAKGPGDFSLWTDDVFGRPEFALSTYDQLLCCVLPVALHAHYNWGFTKPGTYTLVFEVSGTLVDGGVAKTLGIYTFRISDESILLEVLPGDVNQDGVVDEADLDIVESNLGRIANVWPTLRVGESLSSATAAPGPEEKDEFSQNRRESRGNLNVWGPNPR